MSNTADSLTFPTIEDALSTEEVYKPEIIELLVAQLVEDDRSPIAALIMQRQIANSKELATAAASRSNQLHGMHALTRKQLIEAEVALTQVQNKQAKLQAEEEQIASTRKQEAHRQVYLQSRLNQLASAS